MRYSLIAITTLLSLTPVLSTPVDSATTDSSSSSAKKGKIVAEEHFLYPSDDLIAGVTARTPTNGDTKELFLARLLDVQPLRLAEMNKYGIEYAILSHNAPGAQGYSDPATAEAFATKVNDYLYNNIKNNTARFGGLATLSGHNATQAAGELERVVKKYGFKGAMMYDYQLSQNGTVPIYYDSAAHDPLFAKFVELGVPLYLHSNFAPTAAQIAFSYGAPSAAALIGPFSFSNDAGTHVMRMVTGGVFDRNPDFKLVVGHMGEHLPSDLWRLDSQSELVESGRGTPLIVAVVDGARNVGKPVGKQNLSYYFKKNIYTTTSGDFWTDLWKFHSGNIGIDRIMFSVDWPWVHYSDGATWIDGISASNSDWIKLARDNAIKVFKLGLPL